MNYPYHFHTNPLYKPRSESYKNPLVDIVFQRIPSIKNYSFVYKIKDKHNLDSISIHVEGTRYDPSGITEKIETSKITNLDTSTSIITTDSGSMYLLDKQDCEYKRYYADAIQFMKNKGIIKDTY